ncbi:MAG: four-carbon acid sugar kinase family protein [Blastocatellia bacterium]
MLLSFYGDDFTGSADAMEALSLHGVRTILFLSPPSPELLREKFPDIEAVGVAGASRSMTPARMEAALPGIFSSMRRLNARIFHYKICSTFDSSPRIGSIGRAFEIGQRVFASTFVPMLVGAPALKRYCVFGNLFVTAGEETFRLDRHPMMSEHPVTPMDEGDLRVHLGKQTDAAIALFDLAGLTGTTEEVNARFAALLGRFSGAGGGAGGERVAPIVLFDTLDDERLAAAGRLIWESGARFLIGSSGVEYALAGHWQRPRVEYPPAGAVGQLLVMAGSCSAATLAQIEWAEAHGYASLRLDALPLVDGATAEAERDRLQRAALDLLAAGRSVVLYSARGPHDPVMRSSGERLRQRGIDELTVRERLGGQQGVLLRELLLRSGLRRACVAGGDTSSHAISQLGIYALELRAPMAPGQPLCRAYSETAALDGVEIAMKGGQHGRADHFESARKGHL